MRLPFVVNCRRHGWSPRSASRVEYSSGFVPNVRRSSSVISSVSITSEAHWSPAAFDHIPIDWEVGSGSPIRPQSFRYHGSCSNQRETSRNFSRPASLSVKNWIASRFRPAKSTSRRYPACCRRSNTNAIYGTNSRNRPLLMLPALRNRWPLFRDRRASYSRTEFCMTCW